MSQVRRTWYDSGWDLVCGPFSAARPAVGPLVMRRAERTVDCAGASRTALSPLDFRPGSDWSLLGPNYGFSSYSGT